MDESRRPERPVPGTLLSEILWTRLDQPGLEHCRVIETGGLFLINGVVLTVADRQPYRVNYMVACNLEWVTLEAHVSTTRASTVQRMSLRRDEGGQWWRDDERLAEFAGLTDLDLSITPATNTLPIRRLKLAVGARAATDAVWVRFPELSIQRLTQRYSRTGERAYQYESGGGAFTADLEVDAEGIVVRYGQIWERAVH